ncbi:MAG: TonB family protein, partial [Saprospiraceae bacterium]|nr:TonB family protein [Saprospiraceae bacterium]
RNIFYPLEARQNGNEGTVVLSFVVEKDGSISNPKILRDIGGGCGVEALRIVQLMIDGELKWVPGKTKGKPVRTLFNLPVRFKLTEAPPFAIIGIDTIWTTFDEPLSFEGGDEALSKFLSEQMDYPASGNDSCLIGVVDLQLMIDRQSNVRILNITDYNDLGFEFWNEAVEVATSSSGKWKPAVYQGNKVPSAYEVSMSFVPETAACKAKVEQYSKAVQLVNEGSDLFDKGEKDAGIAKMSEGIALFPRDANFLAARGQAYMEMNKFPEACADLSLVKALASVDWYDSLLPVICR